MFLATRCTGRAICVLSLLLACSILSVSAQQSTQQSSSASSTAQSSSTPTANVTVFQTASAFLTTQVTRSGNQQVTITTALPTTINVTSTITPTSTASTNTSAESTSSPSPTPDPYVLDTKVDPAFGVLGAILILTGLPSAFLGHKNRWTSFFLIGFYTLSLVCFVLITRYGILPAINPPSRTLRGMFVLASVVAGIAGGGITIFFWKASRFFIGAWGGFALALWIQCFRNGGLIHTIGIRWIMYIACGVIGFILCTIPKIHYHIILLSTALVGASSIMLGVDCFTTGNLKEFYIWNLGFRDLFPKYSQNGIQFPVSQTMEIELGLIGAIALGGIAVQFRILHVLQRKLQEIAAEHRRRQEEDDSKAAERFTHIDEEKAEWERLHPSLPKHGRQDSEFSSSPLLKDSDGMSTPGLDDNRFQRPRHASGVSEFLAAGPSEGVHRSQSPGVLPALDLGSDIHENVPKTFMAEGLLDSKDGAGSTAEDRRRRDELLGEIQTIRRSLDMLKSETPSASSDERSRHPSLISGRTLSGDPNSTSLTSHLRPPRSGDPRNRAQSMDVTNSLDLGVSSIGRPTSAPLRDNNWDAYVADRKVFQPPAGVSAPIPTTPLPVISPTPRASLSPAVQDALLLRHKRESMLGFEDAAPNLGRNSDSPGSDMPLVAPTSQHKRASSSGNMITVLPPAKKAAAGPPSPKPRTVTYEELNERHRQKMHELQAPLTQAEKESAEILAAKERWERSKNIERQAVNKRQAEREQAAKAKDHHTRPHRATPDLEKGEKHASTLNSPPPAHTRSLSADTLRALTSKGPGASKRVSTMKVEDWQRYQAEGGDAELGVKPKPPPRPPRRDSHAPGGAVPFPDSSRPGAERRGSRMSGMLRDPPN